MTTSFNSCEVPPPLYLTNRNIACCTVQTKSDTASGSFSVLNWIFVVKYLLWMQQCNRFIRILRRQLELDNNAVNDRMSTFIICGHLGFVKVNDSYKRRSKKIHYQSIWHVFVDDYSLQIGLLLDKVDVSAVAVNNTAYLHRWRLLCINRGHGTVRIFAWSIYCAFFTVGRSQRDLRDGGQ